MAKFYDYVVRFYKADDYVNAYDEGDHFDDQEVKFTYVVKYESDLDGIYYDTFITDKQPTLEDYLFITTVHTFLPRDRFEKLKDKVFYCPDTEEMYRLDELVREKMQKVHGSPFYKPGGLQKPKRTEEVDWEKVNVSEIKHPYAHLVKDHSSIIFFWEIECLVPSLIGENTKGTIWFLDDIPVNYPRWAIGNMPVKSAVVRIKEMVSEGWILTETTEDELEQFISNEGN